MAENKKEKKNEKISDKKLELKLELETESSNKKDNVKQKPVYEPEPIKPYIHIDTFLQTAIPLFGLNRMQAAGFKALMNGRHYQTDEQVFVDELKKYLNLK